LRALGMDSVLVYPGMTEIGRPALADYLIARLKQ
jgi:hypothetical protein